MFIYKQKIMYIYIYIYTHTHIHECVYAYIHIHIHIHIYNIFLCMITLLEDTVGLVMLERRAALLRGEGRKILENSKCQSEVLSLVFQLMLLF